MPILALYAYRNGINVNTLLLVRFSIAAGCFFSYLWATGRKITVTGLEILGLLLLGGVLYTLQALFYFSALKIMSPSLTALLLYTYPIIVPLFSFALGKERLTRRHLLAVFLSCGGLILILGLPAVKINLLGVGLALGAALVYSCYIVFGNQLIQKIPSLTASAFITAFAAGSFLIIGLGTHALKFNLAIMGWVPVGGIVLFSTVLAIFTFFKGMERTGPTTAAIISTLEPLVTIFLARLFFQEQLTVLQGLGAIIVLIGAVIAVMAKKARQCNFRAIYPN